ncbi:ion transporter [Mediterraneibacter glycyrrhizinilyticus]|uniref:ion transporter n=1 Tax=Mediterraneibacter glycyrrhizinilyticus TaxID=342942 RepID=UPI0025AAE512|nr:ion transporter [Mediterraneibacter glycyrrhizinilyticus]MCF2570391.1 ion transporter [Mediterraneibacter glycyrrhizinilyticus]MDN0042721.1 ion transporter [Mediterraneibacter glycyrrhizinilyticus]
MDKKKREHIRYRIYEILEVRAGIDHAARVYDVIYLMTIIINLTVSIMYTYESYRAEYGELLTAIENITVALFCIDYILRLCTAKYMYPEAHGPGAVRKYVLSFTGIIDMLSFLPYYLPFFFPSGAVAFRMLRVMRVFRLFRINAYYDSLKLITDVLNSKRQQLFSSVFTILILMLASSLCMYSLEHEAQPEVFTNAFSGIWWSASTLLTVGYGDIYPITTLGKLFGIFITFLGVGMVAIPTGIISAGFVDQYSRIKRIAEYGQEADVHFIRIHLTARDPWVNKSIAQLHLPERVIVAVVQRNHRVLVPRGNLVLRQDDVMVLAAESFQDKEHIRLKEIILQKNNPWNGQRIRDLDISRHSVIVLVKRKERVLIPNGNLILREGDMVILYSEMRIANVTEIEI